MKTALKLSAIAIMIFLLAQIPIKANSQVIGAAIHYNSDGQASGKLFYTSPTWGGYIASYAAVSWQEGKNTEDCFDTNQSFVVGASRSFNRVTINAGIGQAKLEHHCSDDSWDIAKKFQAEAGIGYTMISVGIFNATIDGGLIVGGIGLAVYSGIGLGIKIK